MQGRPAITYSHEAPRTILVSAYAVQRRKAVCPKCFVNVHPGSLQNHQSSAVFSQLLTLDRFGRWWHAAEYHLEAEGGGGGHRAVQHGTCIVALDGKLLVYKRRPSDRARGRWSMVHVW